MKHESMQSLQQRIVKFARDTCPLIDARFQPDRELPMQLLNTEPIHTPQQKQKTGRTGRTEPCRLVVSRKDGEIQRGSGLVPDAVVIACSHAEVVTAGTEIAIKGLAPRPRFLPAGIVPLKHVAK